MFLESKTDFVTNKGVTNTSKLDSMLEIEKNNEIKIKTHLMVQMAGLPFPET